MSNVARKVNDQTAVDLGQLSTETKLTKFSETSPVLATPAAVAAAGVGALAAGGAAVGGYLAEEAADG